MFSPPVLNPAIPFVGPIPGGMCPGKTITFYGHVPSGAHRFNIDFAKTGHSTSTHDIAFHVDTRFDENCIVRNSRFNGSWGTEEREPKYVPMKRGHSFEVMILVEHSCFKVAVNGRHFTEYKHRCPYTEVTTLMIEGNVFISRIEFRETVKFPVPPYGMHPGDSFQVCPPAPVTPVPLGGHRYQPVYSPALPFTYPIYGGLETGTNIYISGRPSASPHRFCIDLQCGTHSSSDIAMHVNPRFDQKVVVRNSRINGNWGTEERHGQFSFQSGITFDMCIQVQHNCFSIFLNGFPFISFSHRILPLNRINAIAIEGDVHISSVEFK